MRFPLQGAVFRENFERFLRRLLCSANCLSFRVTRRGDRGGPECARVEDVGLAERNARTAKRIHRPKVAAEGSR